MSVSTPNSHDSGLNSPAENRGKPGRPPDVLLQSRRRAEILEQATQLFAAHGYADTDVQSLADRISVGKGTIYRYFPTKANLFLAAVDHGMERLNAAVEAAASLASDSLERVSRGLTAYLTYFDQHPEVVELLIQERAHFRDRPKPTYFVHRDANLPPWRELFRSLIQEGRIRDVPLDRITDVLSDLVYGTMFTNYLAGRDKPVTRQAEDILDVVFQGLLTRPTRSNPNASPERPDA